MTDPVVHDGLVLAAVLGFLWLVMLYLIWREGR